MLDPASDLVPPPSSPTISSVSSSDLDTEVTTYCLFTSLTAYCVCEMCLKFTVRFYRVTSLQVHFFMIGV